VLLTRPLLPWIDWEEVLFVRNGQLALFIQKAMRMRADVQRRIAEVRAEKKKQIPAGAEWGLEDEWDEEEEAA
jgi:hypothetical protein